MSPRKGLRVHESYGSTVTGSLSTDYLRGAVRLAPTSQGQTSGFLGFRGSLFGEMSESLFVVLLMCLEGIGNNHSNSPPLALERPNGIYGTWCHNPLPGVRL